MRRRTFAVLLALLGLPADTDDLSLVLDTVRDAVTKPDTDDAAPSAVAAAAKRHGLDVLDHDTHEALKRDAAEGRRLKAAAVQANVEAAVDDAIGKGKITPGRRKHWVGLASADQGMESVLGSIPRDCRAPVRNRTLPQRNPTRKTSRPTKTRPGSTDLR